LVNNSAKESNTVPEVLAQPDAALSPDSEYFTAILDDGI
jgi:hypothetical protein